MRTLLVLVTALLLAVGMASAVPISYSTENYLTQHAPGLCGPGGGVGCFTSASFTNVDGDVLLLAVTNQSATTVGNPNDPPPPVNANYGTITATYINAGSPTANPVVVPTSWHLHINVLETSPDAGTNFFHGISDGGAVTDQATSTLHFGFSPSSMNIGQTTWAIQESLLVNPPNQGPTTIGGDVTVPEPQQVIPEPATLAMLGSGLLALGLYGRRRRQTI